MTELSPISVIPFCGKADEWPIWNEKFMAKAKRYCFKDVSIGSCPFPRQMKSLRKIRIWERKC
jgi:hypothetical protein